LCYLLYAGQKEGGQTLLGGLDITVSRNFFGAQVNMAVQPPAVGLAA
jgi:glutamine amidotransferase PdxT